MKSLCVAFVVCAAAAASAFAQDDGPSLGRLKLDRGFGRGGEVRGIRAGGKTLAHAQRIQVDAAGRIVVAGTTLTRGRFDRESAHYVVRVARFLPDGRLDKSFGGDGLVTLPLDREEIGGLAIDRLGRITVTGPFLAPEGSEGSELGYASARLNDDGSLDTSLSRDGLLELELIQGIPFWDAHMDPSDGSLVTYGVRGPRGAEVLKFFRLKPGGALDAAFGVGALPFLHQTIPDLAIDAEGGVVVVSRASQAAIEDGIEDEDHVFRLRPDGTPDPDFGTLGVLRGAGASVLRGDQVEIDRMGRIVVIGRDDLLGRGVYRYTANGQPDLSFGKNGSAPLALGMPGDARTEDLRLTVARDADEYVISSRTWYLKPGSTSAHGSGFLVQKFDSERPAAVDSFHRRFPRPPGSYANDYIDGAAISNDGTAAFVIQHSSRSRNDRVATLLRIDLTRAARRPLPNLTCEWVEVPALDPSSELSLTGLIRVRNTGSAAVVDAKIDFYVSFDDHLDATDRLFFSSTTGALRAGADAFPQFREDRFRSQGTLTTERLIAHLNPLGELPELSTEDNIAVSEPVESR